MPPHHFVHTHNAKLNSVLQTVGLDALLKNSKKVCGGAKPKNVNQRKISKDKGSTHQIIRKTNETVLNFTNLFCWHSHTDVSAFCTGLSQSVI